MKSVSGHDKRPDYGIDAPYVVRNLTIAGVICLALTLSSASLRWLYTPTISLLATAAIWFHSSKFGKLILREHLMDRIPWNGYETVLDVGCGSGLLLIAAAKRASGGSAVGVDIWIQGDLSNSGREATLNNAQIEGVAERVRVEEGDARRLPFGDSTFDATVSLNVLHNIARREEREQALREIFRVLKPEGRFVLSDFRNTGEYARVLHDLGAGDIRRKLMIGLYFPIFAVTGTKSLA